jgi:hypothetical protein
MNLMVYEYLGMGGAAVGCDDENFGKLESFVDRGVIIF